MSIRRPVVAGDGHLSRGLSDRLRHVLAISCIENTHSPDDLYPASGGGTEVYARNRKQIAMQRRLGLLQIRNV